MSLPSNPCCYYRAFFTVTLLFLASAFSPSQPAASKSRNVVARRPPSWPTPLPAQPAGREPRPDDVDESRANGVTLLARSRVLAYRAALAACALLMSSQALADVDFLAGTGVDLDGLARAQATAALPLASGVALLMCPVPPSRIVRLGALALGAATSGCGLYPGAEPLSWSLAVLTLMAISVREIWYFGGAYKGECGVTLFALPLMLDLNTRVPLTIPACALGLSVLAVGKVFEPCREDLRRSNSEFLAK